MRICAVQFANKYIIIIKANNKRAGVLNSGSDAVKEPLEFIDMEPLSPLKCDANRRKGCEMMKGKVLRLSPNEEAQLLREEQDRRRRLRLQQVRDEA